MERAMEGSRFVNPAERPGETLAKTRRGRWSLKRQLFGAAALAFLGVTGISGVYYCKTGRFLVSTDDAYVEAHSVLISPKVSGFISEASVDDNQPVKAGQNLARIDPRDYQTALDQAPANVAAAQASIDILNQQITQQGLTVEQARQLVTSDQAALAFFTTRFQAIHGPGGHRLRHRAAGPASAGRHSSKASRSGARHHGYRRR
jgi:membrane fusion protein, multidrug efflux system